MIAMTPTWLGSQVGPRGPQRQRVTDGPNRRPGTGWTSASSGHRHQPVARPARRRAPSRAWCAGRAGPRRCRQGSRRRSRRGTRSRSLARGDGEPAEHRVHGHRDGVAAGAGRRPVAQVAAINRSRCDGPRLVEEIRTARIGSGVRSARLPGRRRGRAAALGGSAGPARRPRPRRSSVLAGADRRNRRHGPARPGRTSSRPSALSPTARAPPPGQGRPRAATGAARCRAGCTGPGTGRGHGRCAGRPRCRADRVERRADRREAVARRAGPAVHAWLEPDMVEVLGGASSAKYSTARAGQPVTSRATCSSTAGRALAPAVADGVGHQARRLPADPRHGLQPWHAQQAPM